MTIAPQHPVLADVPGSGGGLRRLTEPHRASVRFPFGFVMEVTVGAGYATDGASVPDSLRGGFGSAWDMPRLSVAVCHDALYSLRYACRWICDQFYLRGRLQHMGAGEARAVAELEYAGVRAAGGAAWRAVDKAERSEAERLVAVRWHRGKGDE